MTPDDVKNIKFPKSRFGGYDMSAVDDFLVDVEKEVAASQSEIQTLRRKMKILVDEIERLRKEINKPHSQQIPNGDEIEYLKSLFDKRENYRGQHEKKAQWVCPYCETINEGINTSCVGCGKEKSRGVEE